MTKKRTVYKENSSKNQRIKCYCNHCKLEINHTVLSDIKENGSEVIDSGFNGRLKYEESTIDWVNDYQIIQCLGCEQISFREQNWFSEYQDFDSDGISVKLFPESFKNKKDKLEFENIPEIIENLYNEAIDVFNSNSLILCAAGLRAIVEGICINQKIKNGNVSIMEHGNAVIKRKRTLEGKINGLFEKEILTQKQATILHELRFMGNEAIHKLNQPKQNDLKLAFSIIESILKTIYDLPEKGRKLAKRRE